MEFKLFELLGVFFIGSVSITSLMGYVLKKLFEHYFDRKIEEYKNNLEIETTKYRMALERINSDHKIQFSKMHQDRADVISQLYSSLVQIQLSMRLFTNELLHCNGTVTQELVSKEKKIAIDADTCIEYFYKKEIFLSNDIIHLVTEIIKIYRDAYNQFAVMPVTVGLTIDAAVLTTLRDICTDALNKFDNEIPPINIILKEELQKLIGIEP